MEIIDVQFYLDGGSMVLITSEGNYGVDWRIKTKTPGALYYGKPDGPLSKLVTDKEVIRRVVNTALNYRYQLETGSKSSHLMNGIIEKLTPLISEVCLSDNVDKDTAKELAVDTYDMGVRACIAKAKVKSEKYPNMPCRLAMLSLIAEMEELLNDNNG